jgi:hypothetical protein
LNEVLVLPSSERTVSPVVAMFCAREEVLL